MKEELLQVRIDAETNSLLKSVVAGVAEATVSSFVRIAIREKLDRDVYGVATVPTLGSIRKEISQMPDLREAPRATPAPETESLVQRKLRERREKESARAA